MNLIVKIIQAFNHVQIQPKITCIVSGRMDFVRKSKSIINIVKCDHKGLNKQACLNIKTQPCIWIKNNINNLEYFQKKIPEGKCEEQNENLGVNAYLCSLVQEDDPCMYDIRQQKCIKPNENLSQYNVEGINVYGCVQIKNCYFSNQTCKLFNPNQNLSCKDVQFANKLVCSQVKNSGCKQNVKEFGCVQQSFFDICSTSGINMKGCNLIEKCLWQNEKCQCKTLLEKQQDCSKFYDDQSCNNSHKCYFEQSQSKQDKGVCKERNCNDRNHCNYELYKGKICYQHLNGNCIAATSCNEIKGSTMDCSLYSFQNIQCVSDGKNGCIQFEKCENLSKIQCFNYNKKCIYLNSCNTKVCPQIQDQYQCIDFGCSWINRECIKQIECSQIQQEKDCYKYKYLDFQCSWIQKKNDQDQSEFCTSNGCRYLHENISCQGTQIGQSVCLYSQILICISCEYIFDSCECIEQGGYCTYDTQKNKCISYPCENHNSQNCPKSRCTFYQKEQVQQHYKLLDLHPKILIPIFKSQCQIFNFCTWDEHQKPPCYEKLQQDQHKN